MRTTLIEPSEKDKRTQTLRSRKDHWNHWPNALFPFQPFHSFIKSIAFFSLIDWKSFTKEKVFSCHGRVGLCRQRREAGRDSATETEEEEQVEVKSTGVERAGMEFWLGHVHGTSADTEGGLDRQPWGLKAHTLHLKWIACPKEHTERRQLRTGLYGTKIKRVHSPRPGREDRERIHREVRLGENSTPK